jgi:hypothetical protein
MNQMYSYLKQTKMLFFDKHGDQEGKTGPVRGLVLIGGGRYKEMVQEGEYSEYIMYSCM